MHLARELRQKSRRIACRANRDPRIDLTGILPEWRKGPGFGGLVAALDRHVGDDADDLPRRVVDDDRRADRSAIRPQPCGQCFVDDGDGRRLCRVAIVELAAQDDRRSQRREIRRPDLVVADRDVLTVGPSRESRVCRSRHRGSIQCPTIDTDSTDGHRAQALNHLALEALRAFGRVFHQPRPHPHQRDMRRLVVAAGQYHACARRKERRRRDHRDGNRGLRGKQPSAGGPSDGR